MAATVTVDHELCIGSGDCVRLVPGAFVIDEARGVSVPQPAAAHAPVDALVGAARNCPTNAIEVVSESGEILVASNG